MIKPKFSIIPHYTFRKVTDITVGFLERLDIKFLMLDLDNTIAAYDEHVLSEDVSLWIDDIRNSGIELFLISNSTRKNRVETFAKSIDVEFIMKSYKPSPVSLLKAMEIKGYSSGESALAGDQVFTDALAANRAGVVSMIVRPRRFTNPFLVLRYCFEVPFRAMSKNRAATSKPDSN